MNSSRRAADRSEPPMGWVEGSITLRSGRRSGLWKPVARHRLPSAALVGRLHGVDLKLADRRIAPRHLVLLLLPGRVFALDLATHSGSRIGALGERAAWLRPGETVDLPGFRLELAACESRPLDFDPWAGLDDPIDSTTPAAWPRVTLARLGDHDPTPVELSTPLAVVGRSPRCALRVDRARASRTHAILLRTATGLLVVDLASRYGTRIDGEDVKMLSSVRPEAVLEFADASYHCRIESASLAVAAPPARVVARPLPADALALLESNTSPDPSRLVSILLAAVQASHQELLRRQDEQARALHAQLETLRRGLENLAHGQSDQSQRVRNDLAELRDEIRRRFAPGGLPRPRPGATPAVRLPPLNTRLTAPDSSTDPAHATSWLLQRLMQINRERAPDEPD